MIDGFINSVLGPAAAPVQKAAASPGFKGYVVPRTVVSWLRRHGNGHDGLLPGTDMTVRLYRDGAKWVGAIDYGHGTYSFGDADEKHVAAALVSVMAGEIETDDSGKARHRALLGRTIDAAVDNYGPDDITAVAPAPVIETLSKTCRMMRAEAYVKAPAASCGSCGYPKDGGGCLCDAEEAL